MFIGGLKQTSYAAEHYINQLSHILQYKHPPYIVPEFEAKQGIGLFKASTKI